MKKTFRIKNFVEGEKKVEPILKFRYANIEPIKEAYLYDEPMPSLSSYDIYQDKSYLKFESSNKNYDKIEVKGYTSTPIIDSYVMPDSLLKKTIEDLSAMYTWDEKLGMIVRRTTKQEEYNDENENIEGN